MTIIAYAIAIIIPLIFLYIIYTQDLYGTGSFRNILISFFWGAFIVGFPEVELELAGTDIPFSLALIVNTWLVDNVDFITRRNLPVYGAPIAEEVLKALILIYLVRRHDFTYFVDGAIYGFAAGMGFAIFENFIYLESTANLGVGTAVGRVVSTNLMHAAASGIVGIALGRARFSQLSGRFLALIGGLSIAMAYHAGFNYIASEGSGAMLFIYAVIGGMGGTGVIAYAIRRGLAEQKRWIEEKLGAADRVTGSEARAVQNLADAHTLLEPLAEIFGADKADDIEQFLVLQARLGIKRKTLDKLPDGKMKTNVEKEMDEIRAKMDAARRNVGSYAMMQLRAIFPEESSLLFGMLEKRIEALAATPSGSGLNVFASIGQHTAKPKATAGETAGAITDADTPPPAKPRPSGGLYGNLSIPQQDKSDEE